MTLHDMENNIKGIVEYLLEKIEEVNFDRE